MLLNTVIFFVILERAESGSGHETNHHDVEHGYQTDAHIAQRPDGSIGDQTASEQHGKRDSNVIRTKYF